MSQWGAYGQARQGRTYRQILATYYPGTELTRTGAARVRVELAAGVRGGQVDATGVFVAADARGKHYRVTSRLLVLAPGLQAPLGKRGKRVALAPPVTLTPLGATLLSFDGRQVRGTLTVSRASGRLSVVNELDLEAYLLGVVPSEMPWAWPAEALKAQAIATRSYTVFSLATSRGKPYDVYADTRSQVYGGVAAESSTASAAVRATSGEILAYGGVVAQTPYFSSSGGRTESSLDVFGTAVPYLQAVADPWDAASPHHAWAPRVLTARGLAAAFGLRSRVIDVTEVPGTTAGATRPEQVVLRLAGGHTVSYDLLEVRDRLRLLSTGFRLGELLLEPPPSGSSIGSAPARVRHEPRVRAGAVVPLRLTGIARAVGEPQLQQFVPAAGWRRVASVRPDADGAFTLLVRPKRTTRYRLVAAGVTGPAGDRTGRRRSPARRIEGALMPRGANAGRKTEIVATVSRYGPRAVRRDRAASVRRPAQSTASARARWCGVPPLVHDRCAPGRVGRPRRRRAVAPLEPAVAGGRLGRPRRGLAQRRHRALPPAGPPRLAGPERRPRRPLDGRRPDRARPDAGAARPARDQPRHERRSRRHRCVRRRRRARARPGRAGTLCHLGDPLARRSARGRPERRARGRGAAATRTSGSCRGPRCSPAIPSGGRPTGRTARPTATRRAQTRRRGSSARARRRRSPGPAALRRDGLERRLRAD